MTPQEALNTLEQLSAAALRQGVFTNLTECMAVRDSIACLTELAVNYNALIAEKQDPGTNGNN